VGAFIDISGQRFDRWTVLKESGRRKGQVLWACLCQCGITKDVASCKLRDGTSRSCGCLARELTSARSRNRKPQSLQKRIPAFWAQVSKGNDDQCWIWNGRLNNKGYGHFPYDAGIILAHRFSWFIDSGVMPTLCVLHRCDVRRCVNPRHLFLGTKGDNNRDMFAKGRNAKNKPNACKIDADTVRLIRRLRIPHKFGITRIARKLNLSEKTVETALYKRKGIV
jgi:hypothetical protein